MYNVDPIIFRNEIPIEAAKTIRVKLNRFTIKMYLRDLGTTICPISPDLLSIYTHATSKQMFASRTQFAR